MASATDGTWIFRNQRMVHEQEGRLAPIAEATLAQTAVNVEYLLTALIKAGHPWLGRKSIVGMGQTDALE